MSITYSNSTDTSIKTMNIDQLLAMSKEIAEKIDVERERIEAKRESMFAELREKGFQIYAIDFNTWAVCDNLLDTLRRSIRQHERRQSFPWWSNIASYEERPFSAFDGIKLVRIVEVQP